MAGCGDSVYGLHITRLVEVGVDVPPDVPGHQCFFFLTKKNYAEFFFGKIGAKRRKFFVLYYFCKKSAAKRPEFFLDVFLDIVFFLDVLVFFVLKCSKSLRKINF